MHSKLKIEPPQNSLVKTNQIRGKMDFSENPTKIMLSTVVHCCMRRIHEFPVSRFSGFVRELFPPFGGLFRGFL